MRVKETDWSFLAQVASFICAQDTVVRLHRLNSPCSLWSLYTAKQRNEGELGESWEGLAKGTDG